jgi:hypothetical protein
MKNSAARLAGLVVILLVLCSPTSAQTLSQVGGHIGLDLDSNEFFFGPNVVLDSPIEVGGQVIQINPEFSYWLEDADFEGASNSFWMITVNGLYPLAVEFADAYAGVGLAISHWSLSYDSGINNFDFLTKRQNVATEISESSTDLGINFKVGASFGEGKFKPNAEFGYVASDSSWPYLQIGVRTAL